MKTQVPATVKTPEFIRFLEPHYGAPVSDWLPFAGFRFLYLCDHKAHNFPSFEGVERRCYFEPSGSQGFCAAR